MGENSVAARVLEREQAEFERRTRRSRERYERALRVLPGADTRAVTFHRPYPAVMERMDGVEIVDIDGNAYCDFLLNYTTMVVGHGHPRVVDAAQAAVARGTAVAAPVPGQLELAEELVRRVPSVERVRFVNSGTEATMLAVRVARAHTGRAIVVKAAGGYHGTYPDLDLNLRDGVFPPGVPDTTPVRLVPYNDLPALEALLAEIGDQVAAVILEPVLGSAGIVPGDGGYLHGAQRATRAAGALFVLDEVVTYRLGPAGAQGLLGLDPDLTAFGKTIGGGFPVGALGGKAAPMDQMAPGADRAFLHSGTFNGNPVTVAAGLATLELLDDDAYAQLDRLGAALGKGLRDAIHETGARAHVTHVGSLANLHFTDEEPRDGDVPARIDQTAAAAFHLGLANRGVFAAPRGMFAVSTAHAARDVERAVLAATEVLAALSG